MPGGAEPLERRQGSVVGAAADRARLRGEVRPHAGRLASATRRSSCAGVPTSSRATAATTSSRSRRLTSSRRSSARRLAERRRSSDVSSGSSVPARRSSRHVLEIHANARPGAKRRAWRRRARRPARGAPPLRVPRFPALEPGERIVFLRARPISISGVLARVGADGCTRAARRLLR